MKSLEELAKMNEEAVRDEYTDALRIGAYGYASRLAKANPDLNLNDPLLGIEDLDAEEERRDA